MRYYEEAGAALGDSLRAKYLPRVLHYDSLNTVMVLEYLDGYSVLNIVDPNPIPNPNPNPNPNPRYDSLNTVMVVET